MHIIQLSDLHTEEEDPAYGVADTHGALLAAVRHILALKQPPACVVITGDLASSGRPGAYALVRDALALLPMPVYVLPGNHDRRATLLEYLGRYCPAEEEISPYLCYSVENGPLRLILLDSTSPGSHSGHFAPPVLDWLDRRLSLKPARPTLLCLHHPPFRTGMGAMDERFENLTAFARIVRRNPQVRICSGHMHRGMATLWEGRMCVGAPSTSLQLDLDFRPEGGDAFVMEAPGYVLHRWTEEGPVVSHFCQIPGNYSYSGPHPFVGVINPV